MTLGERIKDCRRKANMTQEQVGESMQISRQAVTKWESGQSAPSTENLFKLAELFGTTVDFLLTEPDEVPPPFPDTPCVDEDSPAVVIANWINKLKHRICAAAFVGLGYYLFFVIYKTVFCKIDMRFDLFYVLFKATDLFLPYVFGWLLSSGMYLLSASISMLCALFGDFRTTLLTCLAFPAGIFLGEAFGQQLSECHHNGWFIWLCTYFGALLLGIVINIIAAIIKLYLDGK